MRKDYDIVGSYNKQRVSSIDSERTINMFEYVDNKGKRLKTLIFTSGLEDTNLSFGSETGGSRASFTYKDSVYQVFGGTVYRIQGSTGSLTVEQIGTLTTSTGYVGIDANTFQVLFVDGVSGYIFDVNANTFTEITDTFFPDRPIDATYLDGFFVVANGETNNFYLSSFEQGMVWSGGGSGLTFTADSATDFFTLSSTDNYQTGVPIQFIQNGTLPTTTPTALNTIDTFYAIRVSSTQIRVATSYENAIQNVYLDVTANGTPPNSIQVIGEEQIASINAHPGNIVACRTLHRRLFLFSENYTEVWENQGRGTNLPFRRNNSALLEVGTPSVASIATGFDMMFFLSNNKDGIGSVVQINGAQTAPISNRALDFQIAQYAADLTLGITNVADARGVLIKENGLIFYRLNFTNANHTFVYNVSMSSPEDPKWHEEEVINGDRHPAETHFFFKGLNYYAHYNQPTIYIVDTQYSTNAGQNIKRMRIGRPITPEGYNRIRIDRFHLDLLQGDAEESIIDDLFLITQSGDFLITEDEDFLTLNQQITEKSGQPVVFLSISKDGGQSYGNRLTGTMGKLGERTARTVWRKLGTIPRGQSFVPRIEFFSKIPFVVLGASWDFEIMPE